MVGYPKIEDLPRTLFIDIDGTLIDHKGNVDEVCAGLDAVGLLPGVREKINEWLLRGDQIILTTGRRESLRAITLAQLNRLAIPFDVLLMGVSRGERILINDKKPYSDAYVASAIVLERDKGFIGTKDCWGREF